MSWLFGIDVGFAFSFGSWFVLRVCECVCCVGQWLPVSLACFVPFVGSRLLLPPPLPAPPVSPVSPASPAPAPLPEKKKNAPSGNGVWRCLLCQQLLLTRVAVLVFLHGVLLELSLLHLRSTTHTFHFLFSPENKQRRDDAFGSSDRPAASRSSLVVERHAFTELVTTTAIFIANMTAVRNTANTLRVKSTSTPSLDRFVALPAAHQNALVSVFSSYQQVRLLSVHSDADVFVHALRTVYAFVFAFHVRGWSVPGIVL